MFDILLRNGKIVDGTGAPWFVGDIGIAGDRIAAIGNLSEAHGRRDIDAAGKLVCPGFVDCHSHSDLSILANLEATSSIYQGVTTEIVGQCGLGPAPISDISRAAMAQTVAHACPNVRADWSSCREFLDRIGAGVALNVGMLAPHGSIRRAVMGMADRAPTEDEMCAMERLVAESLDAGLLGLSFGLEYAPGSVAEAEELRRLSVVAAQREKPTAWHIRNRDRRFVEATEEALAVTRQAGAALQLAHLSAKPGSSPRAWNRVMELVLLARASGQDVQCDMIPYTTGPGLLSTILPMWATQGSAGEVQARLRDRNVRETLLAQSERYWLLFHYREWDKISLASCRAHPEWIGMTFRQIGAAAGRDPFDCVYDILADEGEGMDGVWINGVLFSEGDVCEWLAHPLFSIASDGFTVKDSGSWREVANHPNCYGWAPTVLQKYVHELRALRLEDAIRKMTSQPAARWGLTERGLLRAHMAADVIVFDESQFRTRATYAKPHVYAEGMEYVIVNGRVALELGVQTAEMAGRVLNR